MNLNNPKRILVIGLTERMGGVESFIYNTTKFSDRSKYEYDYLVHGTDHCVFQNEINDFYSGHNHIYFIRKFKENPIGCCYDLIKFYSKNGKKYTYIHFQTGATSEVMYIFPFCLIYGIKVISHSHSGNGYNPIINRLFRPIVNYITNKRLSCSQVATEWLFGKKYITSTISINNGVDTDRFTFNQCEREKIRSQYNLGDDLIIGHIGRFSIEKNHEKILDIFVEIHKLKRNSKLMLVGAGEKKEIIHQKVKDLNLINSVIFAGSQTKTEDYYSAFDVFLMPSLYEGLPIVGIEAQAEGLPCYFSDRIDRQIMITDRAHMISLEASPVEWTAEILKNLDEDIKIRRNYNRIIDEKGYSIKATVRQLEKVYEV